METNRTHTALAVAAHPDDIEFMMAGTLLLLGEAGCETHMWNMGSGSCGTDSLPAEDISAIRIAEARMSANRAGAVLHPPLAEDIEILYDRHLVSRAAAVIREIRPSIMLVPSPEDYMEDHMNTSRIAVTAAFTRGMPNFATDPPREPVEGDIAIYHALPHGLRDPLRRRVRAGQYVDISGVFEKKRAMLACHESQKSWLDRSQGIGTYLGLMESMSREAGRMSGQFDLAEGWRRHLHWGFGPEQYDPLSGLLGERCSIDADYENDLD